VESNTPSRLHRDRFYLALHQPVCQPVQVAGEGAELAHRLGIPLGWHRYEMTILSAVDAGCVGLDAFE